MWTADRFFNFFWKGLVAHLIYKSFPEGGGWGEGEVHPVRFGDIKVKR